MILLMLLLLLATPVFADAPVSRDDDLLGVWFDVDAVSPCFETTQDYQQVVGYVIISGMSHTLLEGYALGLTVEDEGGLFELDVTMAACSFNALSGLEFMTGGCALPPDPAIVLLTLHATVIQPSDAVYFYLRAIPERMSNPASECLDAPCYYGDGAVFSLNHPDGDWGLPVAAINDPDFCENVARDELPWGTVKTLYR
ncbi:hypothetical protein H8E07_22800 [bacterium]|nr:hypothetical protein [bacterium]